MKNLFITLFIAAVLLTCKTSMAQNTDRNFNQMLQTYYLQKDKDLVDKTIDFINKTPVNYDKLNSVLTGFFGAAFLNDKSIKKTFKMSMNRIEKPDFRQLFTSILNSNIDTLYSKMPVTATLNDMNWSSFFATGNNKYLDRIISHIPHSENRTDLNLFLAGTTAKWSLCGNSRQQEPVNKYLISLKDKNPMLKEILENEPDYFKDATINILKKQRESGIWN